MKLKLFLLLSIFVTGSYSQSQMNKKHNPDDYIPSGRLSSVEFEKFKMFIKTNAGLEIKEDNSYLINYKQPVSDCLHKNYAGSDCDNSWLEKNVYNKISLNESIIKMYFQHKKVKNKRNKKCEVKEDIGHYLYDTFFKKNELCYGLIVVNSEGEFRAFTGEYSDNSILNLLHQLKI